MAFPFPSAMLQGALIASATGIPQLFATGTGVGTNGVSSVALSYPAGLAANQIAIALVSATDNSHTGGASTITAPAGWNEIFQGGPITNSHFSLWWRRLTGAETGTQTFSFSETIGASSGMSGVIVTFTGCVESGTPYEALAAFNVGGTKSAGLLEAMETLGRDRLALAVSHHSSSVNAMFPPNWSEQFDSSWANVGASQALATKQVPAPSASANRSMRWDSSSYFQTAVLALIPKTPSTLTGSTSHTITIPAGRVDADLTDFVVFVDLRQMSAAWWAAVRSDGGDIRAKTTGGTVIPHHLVSYNYGANSGWLAVKKSLLTASSNAFLVDCGDAGLTELAANNANGSEAVWSGYEAVYLFDGDLLDSTANNRDLTYKYGTLAYTTMPMGLGSCLDTTADSFQASNDNGITSSAVYTMAASLSFDVNNTSNQQAVTFCQTYGVSSNRSTLGNRNSSSEPYTTFSADDSWLDGPDIIGGKAMRVAAAYNGSTERKLWVGGRSEAIDSSIVSRAMDTLVIGGGSSSGANWRGRIGFVWLRLEYMSDAWMKAEEFNLADPGAFYTVT